VSAETLEMMMWKHRSESDRSWQQHNAADSSRWLQH